MKIAYFTDTYKPQINGVSYSVDTFAQYLSKNGHTVRVYAPSYKFLGSLETDGPFVVERYSSFAFPTYKEIHISTPNLIKMIRSLNKFKPDVIHLHTPGVMGLAAIIFAKKMDIPLFGTYHTLFSEQIMYLSPAILFNSVALKINQAIDSIQKTGSDSMLNSILQKLDYLKTKQPTLNSGEIPAENTDIKKLIWDMLNSFYNACDLVIAPSESIKGALLSQGLHKPVEVVSNGIDLSMFPPKNHYGSGKKLLYVGRVSFEKNINVVLKSFEIVYRKDSAVRLTIAGDGPALESLKSSAANLKIESAVEFLGWVDRAALSELYRQHDVFVTASTMETQGIVLLEALSSGLPAIGVDKYAIPDIIKDGVNGFVVGAFDEQKFADRILRLISYPEIIKTFGQNAVYSVQEHDIVRNVLKMENLYKSISSR